MLRKLLQQPVLVNGKELQICKINEKKRSIDILGAPGILAEFHIPPYPVCPLYKDKDGWHVELGQKGSGF